MNLPPSSAPPRVWAREARVLYGCAGARTRVHQINAGSAPVTRGEPPQRLADNQRGVWVRAHDWGVSDRTTAPRQTRWRAPQR